MPYDIRRKIITPPNCHCCCFILGVPKTTTHELWANIFDLIIQITTTLISHTVIISFSMRTLGRFFLNSCYIIAHICRTVQPNKTRFSVNMVKGCSGSFSWMLWLKVWLSVVGVHPVSVYNCSDMITYWTITCTILTLKTVLFGTNINICIGQYLPDRAK